MSYALGGRGINPAALSAQVNDMNDASIRDFAAKLEAAAAAAPGSSSKVELRSAVKDREFDALSATVNALSACPHNVREMSSTL
jgi:hypothetical protein